MKKSKPRRGRQPTPNAPAESPKRLKVPPILLEGDEPATELSSKSKAQHSMPTEPVPLAQAAEPAALPEAYGTGQLLLLPKDPHSLYAHWDLTRAQQQDYRDLALEKKLVLRVRKGTDTGAIAAELPIASDSRDSFIYVPTAGSPYVAELGYYDSQERWVAIAVSQAVVTPRKTLSSDKSVQFSLMPPSADRKRAEQKRSEETRRSLPPPRVGWLPSLGIVPGADARLREISHCPEGLVAGQEIESAGLISREWTLEADLALEALLAEGSLEEHLSSFSLQRAGF